MYTEFHEYAWRTARQRLDFEIGKVEGQLRNCRFRMDLAKRGMIVCIMTVIIPYLFFIVVEKFPISATNLISVIISFILSGLHILYICLLPFLVYSMVKAIMFYFLSKKESIIKESLREYTGYTKDTPAPEKSYVIEEDKLIRILLIYYDYRRRLDEMQEKLKDGELSMTVEEMQEEIDRMVYFQAIIPASPFKGELLRDAKIWTVLICIILLMLMFMLKLNKRG